MSVKTGYCHYDDLRLIARHFSIRTLSFMNKAIPEELILSLDKSLLLQNNSINSIWEDTYISLQTLDYSNLIFNWLNTLRNQEYRLGDRVGFISSWEAFLIAWSKKTSDFDDLIISDTSIQRLKVLIQNSFIKYQQIKLHVENIKQMPDNAWEEFVFVEEMIGPWITKHTSFVIWYSFWKDLLCNSHHTELTLINQWGYMCIEKYTNLPFFSIEVLANDICVAQ